MSALMMVNPLLKEKIISPKSKLSFKKSYVSRSRHRNASLTVEAALVVPFFFFTFFLLWQLFLLLMFQIKVCERITETAKEVSCLGYAQRQTEEQRLLPLLYEPLFRAAIPENERVHSDIVHCTEKEQGMIQVQVSYEFCCDSVFFLPITLPVKQMFCFYPYLGEKDPDLLTEQQESADVVYVTEHGTVYHESKSCVYLEVVLTPVSVSDVEDIRNSYGERYQECSRCKEKEGTDTVYVSRSGNRYHKSLDCPTVKRTVQEKDRSEAGNLPVCHKCKQ